MMGKSTVAGIMTIISGAWGFLYALWAMVYGVFIVTVFRQIPASNGPPVELLYIIAAMAGLYALFFAALGALAIVGGIFSLKKNRWSIALAGAIAGNITFMPIGIIGVIFVSLAKSEFDVAKGSTPGAVTAPPSDAAAAPVN